MGFTSARGGVELKAGIETQTLTHLIRGLGATVHLIEGSFHFINQDKKRKLPNSFIYS